MSLSCHVIQGRGCHAQQQTIFLEWFQPKVGFSLWGRRQTWPYQECFPAGLGHTWFTRPLQSSEIPVSWSPRTRYQGLQVFLTCGHVTPVSVSVLTWLYLCVASPTPEWVIAAKSLFLRQAICEAPAGHEFHPAVSAGVLSERRADLVLQAGPDLMGVCHCSWSP